MKLKNQEMLNSPVTKGADSVLPKQRQVFLHNVV